MTIDLHHVHIFASDVDKTITWWRQHLDAKVLFDGDLAGSRNVLIAVGTGRLNIYEQSPRDSGRGAVHHLGIRVAGLRNLWESLRASGISSRHGLREHDGWRYVMVSAPDDLLLELFEFDDRSAAANIDGRV
jgi:catechol 2,3-dioxygenase-like lactoylglutathione lyase family enzyme